MRQLKPSLRVSKSVYRSYFMKLAYPLFLFEHHISEEMSHRQPRRDPAALLPLTNPANLVELTTSDVRSHKCPV